MRRIAIALTVAVTLTVSIATAGAASVNQTSDQAALNAYSGYLGSIVSRAGYGKSDDAKLIKLASANCKGALATAINNSSPTKQSKAALGEIGEEIGGDVAIKFLDEAHQPYAKLARKLNALHWSSKSAKANVHSFVSALHTVLTITPSLLCRDTLNLSSKLQTEPSGTKKFLKTYLGDSTMLQNKLTSLVTLLERYETDADAQVVTRIDARAKKFNTVSGADEKASRTELVSVLKQS